MNKSKNDTVSSILSGAFSLTLATVIVKVLGLIYKIPLSNMLGDEGMGYFNSAYTVYAFFYLLCTAGVPKAVMILVSECKAKGKRREESEIVRVATLAFLVIGVTVTLVFMIFAGQLSTLIGNSKAKFTMLAIAPSIVFISISGVIRGYMSANMRLLEIAVSQIIEGVGKLAFGLLFAMVGVRLKMPLEVVSAFTIIGVSLGALFGLAYLYVCSKSVKIGYNIEQNGKNTENAGAILKRIFSVSIPITVSAAIMSATSIIDLGLIMRSLLGLGYTDAEASAFYGNYTTLAVPMFNLAIALVTPISIAFLPTFAKARIGADAALLKKSVSESLTLSAIVSAPILIGMVVFSKEILSLLFGNSGIETGSALLCLIAPAIFFSSTLLTVNSALEAGGQVRAPLVAMIFGSLGKILVSYILLTNENFGICGAPIGTVVCYAIALLVSGVMYITHTKSSLPVLSCSLVPYLSAFVSVMASRWLYVHLFAELAPFISLGLAVAVSALIYVVLLAFSGVLRQVNLQKTAKYTKSAC